jgi:F0F1-type ATP synthase assembly protein I
MTLFDDDQSENEPDSSGGRSSGSTTLHLFDDDREASEESDKKDEPFVLSQAAAEDSAETARKSGLAWSAGIAFFGAVVFMLILGWGFDLLFGSKPWGLVGGIIFGSIIGFIQFFRISSQIFKK